MNILGHSCRSTRLKKGRYATLVCSAFAGLLTSSVATADNISVDVNRATFSHDNRAYVPLFDPSDSKSWIGNIKGYFIGEDGSEDVDGVAALETVDSVVKFTDDARSFWSNSADGNTVKEGGASAGINPDARNLYTYMPAKVSRPIHLASKLPHLGGADLPGSDH